MFGVTEVLFYFLASLTLLAGLGVVVAVNPIYSALCLVLSMLGVAGIFLHLGAHFLAGVQVIVYAGAVVVLFVMVVMLFDLKKEIRSFTPGLLSGAIKISMAALFASFVMVAAEMSIDPATQGAGLKQGVEDLTKEVATLLFSKYLFVFEILSVLLLVVVVGAIALSKSPGGSHAQSQ